MQQSAKLATLGGGCFWCLEAAFQRLKGVKNVVSGYSGGVSKQIIDDHAEVIQIQYNPNEITYESLLQAFFTIHDPTTMNRQGYDVGTKYRSIILYHDENQQVEAQKMVEELTNQKIFKDPIVTIIQEYEKFYKAEQDHQNFYNNNKNFPYCTKVINPKLSKLRKKLSDQLTEEEKNGCVIY